jgi:ribosomal protein S18 acetylase RimI-like enzyme
MNFLIREALPSDHDAIWSILKPILRAGETYALPREWKREQAISYWFKPGNTVFVAVQADEVAGTYYLHANQEGGGAHVANCGYATASQAQGQGVASVMCEHSLKAASSLGFLAMQFNLVISTNERAVNLWRRFGFEIVGTIPSAFNHPRLALVDAFVMHRFL